MPTGGLALLQEGAQLRERALALRTMVRQAQPDNPAIDDPTFSHICQQLKLALAKEEEGRLLLAAADTDEDAQPSAAPANGSQHEGIATAAAVTAFVLPLGMVTLNAAIAAGPYLGADVGANMLGLPPASVRVRAVLRRDSKGIFRLVLRDDARGIYIFGIDESDAADERERLCEGDYVASIDALPVIHSATAATAAADGPLAQLTLEQVKQHIRDAAESITIEVWREEIRPAAERVLEYNRTVIEEVKKVAGPALEAFQGPKPEGALAQQQGEEEQRQWQRSLPQSLPQPPAQIETPAATPSLQGTPRITQSSPAGAAPAVAMPPMTDLLS